MDENKLMLRITDVKEGNYACILITRNQLEIDSELNHVIGMLLACFDSAKGVSNK